MLKNRKPKPIPRSRVKQQSNFYTLEKAIKQFAFPLTVQVIPSVEIAMFDVYQRHILTFIGSSKNEKLKCVTNNGCTQWMPVSDNTDIVFTPICKQHTYMNVADIIKYRFKHNITWIVAFKKVVFNDKTIEIGNILELEERFTKRKQKNLIVTMHPSLQKIHLPLFINGEFKKCENPYITIYKRLSKVGDELPCIMRYPKNVSTTYTDNMLVLENVVSETYIACKQNSKIFEIHTFSSNMQIDVEVLEGEVPVDVIDKNELSIIQKKMIDLNFNNISHNVCLYGTLNLKPNDQTDTCFTEGNIYTNYATNNRDNKKKDKNHSMLEENLQNTFLSSKKLLTTKSRLFDINLDHASSERNSESNEIDYKDMDGYMKIGFKNAVENPNGINLTDCDEPYSSIKSPLLPKNKNFHCQLSPWVTSERHNGSCSGYNDDPEYQNLNVEDAGLTDSNDYVITSKQFNNSNILIGKECKVFQKREIIYAECAMKENNVGNNTTNINDSSLKYSSMTEVGNLRIPEHKWTKYLSESTEINDDDDYDYAYQYSKWRK